jgi:hypothetical protein
LAIVWLGAGLISACDDPEDVDVDGGDATAFDLRPERAAALRELVQEAYVKASNTGAGDGFGGSVALSADGSTLAVGAPLEDSAATGIDGDQADDSADGAGAVYVFRHRGKAWIQEAYLKASNTGAGDNFGASLALSADGSTLAVGAPYEGSAAAGVGGDQADDSAWGAGAVYVLTRSGQAWAQQAYVKASNPDAEDRFGSSVALSANGSILAVGAWHEDSAAAGNQADNSVPGAGAIYVLARGGAAWSQQAYVKAPAPAWRDELGYRVALSADGSTLAAEVGSHQEPYDDGAVHVFTLDGLTWTPQAHVLASNPEEADRFGSGVALSADGSALAVGAYGEDSRAIGVGGDQADNSAPGAGAAYVLARGGPAWSQQAYVKASNTGADDFFGASVALSADGSALVVGALGEDSAATCVGGDQADGSADDAGAAYVLARGGPAWSQQAYVKASNTDAGDFFGASVALSADGSILAVGAPREDSAATGVGGDPADDTASSAGAVYVFRWRR